jgi:GlpG protein
VKLRITYNAPVVLTFALAAVAAFIITRVAPSAQQWFVSYPRLGPAQTYAGLFTHILGHASWEHLLSNFMLILLIGPILEERHGSLALLGMILLAALVTGLANLALGSYGVLGASGIAFMMILLASMVNVRDGEIPLSFVVVVVIYIGGEIVHSFNKDQVSHMAHIVGGAVGAVFGFLAARPRPSGKLAARQLAKLKI